MYQKGNVFFANGMTRQFKLDNLKNHVSLLDHINVSSVFSFMESSSYACSTTFSSFCRLVVVCSGHL